MFGLSIALMIAALKFGPEIKGAHRWINFGPFGVQPSELAKPSFVVIVAWFFAERTKYPDMPGNYIAYGLSALFVGLLVLQPDFGQTALIAMTLGGECDAMGPLPPSADDPPMNTFGGTMNCPGCSVYRVDSWEGEPSSVRSAPT